MRWLLVAIAALGSVSGTACDRPRPAPEELALEARNAHAAELASAAAAVLGFVPLGAAPVLYEEPFGPERPSSFAAPVTTTSCNLDLVANLPAEPVTSVSRDAPTVIVGWAADVASGTIPPVVVLELAGPTKSYYGAATRITTRPDVAAAMKMPALRRSGYDVHATLRAVEPGVYAVRVLQVSASGMALACDTGKKLKVE